MKRHKAYDVRTEEYRRAYVFSQGILLSLCLEVFYFLSGGAVSGIDAERRVKGTFQAEKQSDCGSVQPHGHY